MNDCEELFQVLAKGLPLPDSALPKAARLCRAANGDYLIHRCRTLEQLKQIGNCLPSVDLTGGGGVTSLMVYAQERRPEFCRFLLEHGASPHPSQPGTHGPLHRANHPEIVEMLVTEGADIEAVAAHGLTPFLFAIFHHQHAGMVALARHGANINAVDDQGNSAIHIAARVGFCDAIRFCLEHGFDVNLAKQTAQTPLFFAVMYNRYEAVQLLIESGAQPNIRDTFGKLPFDYLSVNAKPEMEVYVREHGGVSTTIEPFSGSADEFAEALRDHPRIRKLKLRLSAVSSEAIAALEDEYSVSLPGFYRSFLELCGNGPADVFQECEWQLEELAGVRDTAQFFCREQSIELPGQAFVFLAYLGENFWYFECTGRENPEVHFFDVEGRKSTEYAFADLVLNWETHQL